MKCTNKFAKIFSIMIMASLISGCSNLHIWMPFSVYENELNINKEYEIISKSESDSFAKGFASEYAVIGSDVANTNVSFDDDEAGILVAVNDNKVLYSKNSFEFKAPASITKIMTAYVVIQNCKMDEMIVCGEEVEKIDVYDAVVCGLRQGDKLTVNQALNLALINSYNDAAIALAAYVGGGVEHFVEMMNEAAANIGATGTHFEDPTGLSENNHFTTAYDLYLIFNKALEMDELSEIIACTDYQTVYHDRNDKEITVYASNTNQYLRGACEMPSNITVIGGKTGTTDTAGHCLILYARDNYSNPYIALVMNCKTSTELYEKMSDLLTIISN